MQVLRLFQYATLHSLEDKSKNGNPTYNVYVQMRMVRKILRFLRSLEYSTKIREQFPKLMNSLLFPPALLKHLTSILQNLFTVLYFLSDHRVCLGELGVIDKQYVIDNLPRSMRFYFLQNIFGILHNLVLIFNELMKGQQKKSTDMQKIKSQLFDLIRCFIDCFVALFYWKGKYGPKGIGKLGVISSIMAIVQSLGYI